VLAGRDELRLVEVPVLRRGLERVQAGGADGQVRPVEVARPLVLAGQRDRRDALALDRLNGRQELGPGRGRRGDAGLGEQVLVVPEPDHADVERDAVDLAVDRVRLHGRGQQVADPTGAVRGEVLDQAGLDLLREHAAAPRLEDVRRVAGLRHGRQLGLERLVLQGRDGDLHVRVRGLVCLGHVRPDGEHRVGGVDRPPVDGLGGVGVVLLLLVVVRTACGERERTGGGASGAEERSTGQVWSGGHVPSLSRKPRATAAAQSVISGEGGAEWY